MNFTAIILAGGRSRRMGSDKAWLPFNGKPLVAHMLSIVREAGATEVMISARAGQDYQSLGCPVLFDAKRETGPLAGIERGLSSARTPLVLVLAVDLPHMKSEFLCWLATHCGEDRGAIPMLPVWMEPLAAFYPKRAHQVVLRCIRQKRLAAQGFARTCLREELARAVAVTRGQEACFANWNTPEDVST